MSIAITSPITGSAQNGLTSPTYTVVTDTPPDVNAKQSVVTALGGTQTGVRVHAVSDPFTIAFFRPKSPKALPAANPITGRYGPIPKNTYAMVVRKGVNCAASQPPEVCITRVSIDVPAGSDAYDSINIRAAMSAFIGSLSQQSAGLGDLLVNGVL
jgi:hypothetical protein